MSNDIPVQAGQTGVSGTMQLIVPQIDYESYTLPNGLKVVIHPDHSNPIVAIAILFHVGSSRETPGKTGFAHFFEHMLFQRSENIPKGEFFRKINDLGGMFNGGTWQDGTVYYEVVPADALEKILWMESDRMGFLINTVTQNALEREKDIVINEKRQRVDNQPYGHTSYVIDRALYPAGHPYSWQVIGSMDDVRSASIDDVKTFYEKYYAVNNATIVVAGDCEPANVKKLIEKYFGEFKSRPVPPLVKPATVIVEQNKYLYHEDRFALLPELNVVFPAAPMYHEDSYALSVLGDLLAESKKAILYKEIVEKRKLAPDVSVHYHALELSGKFTISVRAFEGVDLNEVYEAVFEALRQFGTNRFSEVDLQRIKNLNETNFYQGISTLLDKSFQLVQARGFGNDPARFIEDMHLLHKVSEEDVMRVFEKYLASRGHIASSFVPVGQTNLVVKGSAKADVVEENAEAAVDEALNAYEDDDIYEFTNSTFDRRKEPELGTKRRLKVPEIFSTGLSNGLKVLGITDSSLPLVYFSLRFKGGHALDNLEKPGMARLLALMMSEGTKNKTPEELEERIGQLGASIQISSSYEYLTLSGNCLSRNFESVMHLVQEIILEPRWDTREFDRLKKATVSHIVQQKAQPGSVAMNVFLKRIYGNDHILGTPITGTEDSVNRITLHDLQLYYADYLTPAMATFHFAGDLNPEKALSSLGFLGKHWHGAEATIPEYPVPESRQKPELYFVDVADAKQSVIIMGLTAMPRNHPDFAAANMVNYKLGDGSGGRLFTILRLEKGYTYGAYSFFMPRVQQAVFVGNASVQSAYTLESLKLFNEILTSYTADFTPADLETTRMALVRANAGKYEHLQSKLDMLHDISTYNLPKDYVTNEEMLAEKLTFEQARSIGDKYIKPGQMIYVVTGDARSQMSRLVEAGLGEPVLLDKNGEEL